MRKTVQACVVVAACGFPAAVLGVSQPRLIADLATVPSPQEGSVPAEFVQVGAYLLFTARPDDHARRLWRSDGTAAGTQELANACGPLEEGGFALRFATPARAFYSVSCGGGAKALWVSDGTPSGTQVLLGVGSYDDTGALIAAAQWVEDDDDVLFLQRGGYNLPLELWRSDGSVGGTARIAVVSESDRVTGALHRRGAGDLLLLVEEPSRKLVVWRSDGTPAGTQPARVLEFPDQYLSLRSVHPTATGIAFMVSLAPPSRNELWYSDGTVAGTGLGAVLPDLLSEVPVTHEGSLYFTAEVNGEEWLWRGDGSAATTRPIVPLGSRGARSDSFEFFDGRLYFVACEADRRSCALLSTAVDGGLPAHVAAVCDDDDCVEIDDDLWVRGRGSRLIFTHRDETSVEVWTSAPDGSGAAVVATLCAAESCFGPHVGPMVLESAVFFATVADAGGARELWSSDGTVAGTLRLAGPLPDIQWYVYPDVWAPLAALPGGGGWVFAAADTEHGLELWRARPQADSGAMVEDLRPDRPGLFNPEPVGTVGSTFVFALLSEDGNERTLYRHAIEDGPVEPFLTVPVHRGRHGIRNNPPALRPAGNAWFFIEYDLGDEYSFAGQIWRYDPVSRDLRTLFADDPQETGIGARADDLVPSGTDVLFLGARDRQLHPAIYRVRPRSGVVSKLMDLPAERATSIGRSGGFWFLVEDAQRVVAIDLAQRTRTVLDDFPGAFIGQAVALEAGALFEVDWGILGTEDSVELRRSDGTGPGTQVLAEWSPATGGCGWHLGLPPKGSASPALFTVQVYCTAVSSELWISDGSVERTGLLRTFPDDELAIAAAPRSARGELFFLTSRQIVNPGSITSTIWKTDGTAPGTQAVAALPSDHSSPWDWREGAQGAEAFYFAWSDLEHGRELWGTDGTAAGTGLAADIEPGPESSSPWQLRTVGDQVIFRAGTAGAGLELWQVDGGFPTAQPVADLYPGIESSAPLMLGTTDEALYFLADDGVVGREIWQIDRPSVAPCVADATTLCLAGGRFRARAVRRDFEGGLGAAGVVPLTGDSGYFWFFDEGYPEVMLKIVDACDLPGFENFWSYSTGLTNVEVELEVVDTASGERQEVRTALGEAFGPLFDSGSFEVCDGSVAVAPARAATAPRRSAASPASPVLALLDGRFEATATWATLDGRSGAGQAVAISGDSGYFWFFAPSIVEVLVKMVDACGYPGFDNFWVFAGGLTDVEVHLAVRDTWSGLIVSHDSAQGSPFTPLLETAALRVCSSAP